jgi:Ca2+-binding RTX toxin-like protein
MANVYGTNSTDYLYGLTGTTNFADAIFGFGGDDLIAGLGGDDLIKGGGGADAIHGGEGTDTADYSDSDEPVAVFLFEGQAHGGHGYGGTADGDLLVSIENLNGSSHADWLIGNEGSNVLRGLAQNDTLEGRGGDDTLNGDGGHDVLKGGGGADILNGGAGIDTADYSDSPTGVYIVLSMGGGFGGDATGDQLNSIENLTGSAYADNLTGTNGANVLEGLNGDDTLTGLDGFDTLHGGRGDDILYGGNAADVFVFDTTLNASTNVDTIMDFDPAGEYIYLDNAIFSNLDAEPGHFVLSTEFYVGTAANDADDHIIYDDSTGAIFYDKDGSGAAMQVQFAAVTPGLTLAHDDFHVF